MVEDWPSVDELVSDFTGFTHRHVQLALAYREAYPEEIEHAIEIPAHPHPARAIERPRRHASSDRSR